MILFIYFIKEKFSILKMWRSPRLSHSLFLGWGCIFAWLRSRCWGGRGRLRKPRNRVTITARLVVRVDLEFKEAELPYHVLYNRWYFIGNFVLGKWTYNVLIFSERITVRRYHHMSIHIIMFVFVPVQFHWRPFLWGPQLVARPGYGRGWKMSCQSRPQPSP